MAQDWDIKPRSNVCHRCHTTFEDGQACYSALVVADQGYERGDFCAACWDGEKGQTLPYSLWQGIYRSPPPPEEEALKKETAESLLRRLMEDKNETRGNVIYILAVMLERKRLLIERDVKKAEDGSITRVYEHRRTGDTFLVPDPQLRLDELEHVQQEVVDLLGSGREADATAEPAPPVAAADPTDAQNRA